MTRITVYCEKGFSVSTGVRLSDISKVWEEFRNTGVKSIPIFPWVLRHAFIEAEASFPGKVIKRINIEEKKA